MAGSSAWSRDADVKDSGVHSTRGFTHDKVTVWPQELDDVFNAFGRAHPPSVPLPQREAMIGFLDILGSDLCRQLVDVAVRKAQTW